MTEQRSIRVLAVVVCGAGPAATISTFIALAQERGWTVQVIATPAALDFFDQAAVEKQTGNPVKSQYSKPGDWAHGISDTYALGVLAEMTSLDIPIVVLPFVNTALADRVPFRSSVETLRREGVRILIGPGAVEPHPPRTGGTLTGTYPWHLALDEAHRLLDCLSQQQGKHASSDRCQ